MSGTPTHVRFGTDLITFFNTDYWGISPEPSYEEWMRIVEDSPRTFLDGMLDGCVEAGVEGVELAPAPGGWRTAISAYGSAEGFRRALEERGLVLSSSFDFGGGLMLTDDPDGADRLMAEHSAFVAAAGGRHIVLGSVARAQVTEGIVNAPVPLSVLDEVGGRLNRLGQIARDAGLTIALHTDAYSICSRAEDIAGILERTDASAIGLCLDAGHVTLDGGNAVEILRSSVDRVPIMHWKDCIGALDGSTLHGPVMERHATMLTYFRILGSGIVDWKAWQEILRDADWSGWAVAEIDMSPDPIGEIRQGLEFFRRELASIHC
jgi:inosose dehydratase